MDSPRGPADILIIGLRASGAVRKNLHSEILNAWQFVTAAMGNEDGRASSPTAGRATGCPPPGLGTLPLLGL